jgi:hypothetical protein
MIVETQSGSVYEIDEGHRRARLQGDDWRHYDAMQFIGGRLCIMWDHTDTVLTTPVVRVKRDDGTELLFGREGHS